MARGRGRGRAPIRGYQGARGRGAPGPARRAAARRQVQARGAHGARDPTPPRGRVLRNRRDPSPPRGRMMRDDNERARTDRSPSPPPVPPRNPKRPRFEEPDEVDFTTDPRENPHAGEFIDFTINSNKNKNVGNSSRNGCGKREKYVNILPDLQSGLPNPQVREQVRLSSDDIAAHIPATLKQTICKGDYINIALLLKGAIELNEYCRGSMLYRVSENRELVAGPRECRQKVQNIEQWTNAFLIYISVYLQNYPDRTHELLQYVYNIRECAARQGGFAFREYDEQFRLRQAACTIPMNWSVMNNDLYWRIMMVKDNGPSRRRQTHVMYTCDDFNHSECSWFNCKYNHVCENCGASDHPAWSCFNKGTQQSNSFNPNRGRFRGRYPRSGFRGSRRGRAGRH